VVEFRFGWSVQSNSDALFAYGVKYRFDSFCGKRFAVALLGDRNHKFPTMNETQARAFRLKPSCAVPATKIEIRSRPEFMFRASLFANNALTGKAHCIPHLMHYNISHLRTPKA